MKPKDLLTFWGTQAEVCRVAGVHHPTAVLWFNENKIPEGRQYQFELASMADPRVISGKMKPLKADRPADRRSLKRKV